MIILDTHVMIWRAADDSRLGRRASRRIAQALREGALAVSAFSFWEVARLVAAGRFGLRASADDFRDATLETGIIEVPVDGRIAILSTRLAGMHPDPADRLIVATTLERRATLVTADAEILAMKSGPSRLDAQV